MLPFSRRKKPDEIELDDADIVVLEEEPMEVDIAELEVRPELPRLGAPPKVSLRRLVTPHEGRDRFEDDVADECLKSIAAATSRARLSDSFPASIVPPAPRIPTFDASVDELLADAPLPQFQLSDADETTRRPALSSSSSMPIARDSVPGVLAVPSAPASVSSIPTPVFSRTSSPALPAVSSIAPVSMSSADSVRGRVEPTVILVRQPPKTAWIVAAALLGAACALLAMRLLTTRVDPPAIVVAAPPPPPVTQATPAAPPPPATVRFDDAHGVAVIAAPPAPPAIAAAPAAAKPAVTTASMKTTSAPVAPAATPVAQTKPAPKPAPPSLGPKLPDGSMALTKSASAPQGPTAASPPASQPEPATPAGPKKRLTPEQELAEAQLKASMK